jgi:hypothetical protein
MNERVWEKHPQAKLNRPVQGYRHVLSAWVKRRAKIDKSIKQVKVHPDHQVFLANPHAFR